MKQIEIKKLIGWPVSIFYAKGNNKQTRPDPLLLGNINSGGSTIAGTGL